MIGENDNNKNNNKQLQRRCVYVAPIWFGGGNKRRQSDGRANGRPAQTHTGRHTQTHTQTHTHHTSFLLVATKAERRRERETEKCALRSSISVCEKAKVHRVVSVRCPILPAADCTRWPVAQRRLARESGFEWATCARGRQSGGPLVRSFQIALQHPRRGGDGGNFRQAKQGRSTSFSAESRESPTREPPLSRRECGSLVQPADSCRIAD